MSGPELLEWKRWHQLVPGPKVTKWLSVVAALVILNVVDALTSGFWPPFLALAAWMFGSFFGGAVSFLHDRERSK